MKKTRNKKEVTKGIIEGLKEALDIAKGKKVTKRINEKILMKKTKNKKLKPIPSFKAKEEERKFWDKADTTEYFDFSKANKAKFPNLKFSKKAI